MTITVVSLENRVELLQSENRLLPQTKENIPQRSRLSPKIPGAAEKSLVKSIPNKFIKIAVKVEDAINTYCKKEVLVLAYYEKHIEGEWTSRDEIVVRGCVKRQNRSKFCPSIIHVGR